MTRPVLDDPAHHARALAAAAELAATLQRAHDQGDADGYDSAFAADVLWGSPFGASIVGHDTLNAIHRRLMAAGTAPPSRFEVVAASAVSPDVVVTQIRRQAADPDGFSELALYVLVERNGSWWVSAAQNSPVGVSPLDSVGSMRLAVVIGSVREGRFGPVVAGWFAEQARRHGGVDVDLVDLAETPLGVTGPSASSTELTPRLAAADAFVIVTPEYNHSYPSALKNAIDWHGREFRAKPVGFVCYGGLAGGLRAVEHLRPVFAELHAVTTRDTVSFHNAWDRFDEDGRLTDPEPAVAAAKVLLDQIVWWARALREAKTARPYAA